MALFVQADYPLIELHETYPKQTLRNRCNIMTANGVLRLTVPVKKPQGNKTKTSEVLIDNSLNWAVRHLRSLTSAYRKTPYFEYFENELSRLLLSEPRTLVQLNSELLSLVLVMLRIQKEWHFTETFSSVKAGNNCIIDFEKSILEMDFTFPNYLQAFSERFGFMPDLSILDLVFNLGPLDSLMYLKSLGLANKAKKVLYSG